MTSIRVVDNPILKFASRIEKVETRTQIEEIIKIVNEDRHFSLFQLGGGCRPECGWNFRDAISSSLKLSDHAARSIG